jgi:hypothetical protein
VVVNTRPGDPRERNLELGMSWFQHRDEWTAMPADGGPASWQRIDVAPDVSRRQDDRVDIVQPVEPITPVPLPAVTVSDVELGDQDLRFTVDQVGVPVLVKISYFPNWKVSGAEGPWRIAPNMMVVVPTSNDVHLTYGRSAIDIGAYVLTLIGIALLFVWRRRGDVVHVGPTPGSPWDTDDQPSADDAGPDGVADSDDPDATVAIVRDSNDITLIDEPRPPWDLVDEHGYRNPEDRL